MRHFDLYNKKSIQTEADYTASQYKQRISGVKIGFEFELCIPFDTVNRPQEVDNDNSWIVDKTVDDIMQGVTRSLTGGRNTNIHWGDRLNDIFRLKSTRFNGVEMFDSRKITDEFYAWALKKKLEEVNKPENKEKGYQLLINVMKTLKNYANGDLPDDLVEIDYTSRSQIEEQAKSARNRFIEIVDTRTDLNLRNLRNIDPQSISIDDYDNISDIMGKFYYQTDPPVDAIFSKAQYNLRDLFGRTLNPAIVNETGYMTKFIEFCMEIFGTTNIQELLRKWWTFNGRTNNATPALKNKLRALLDPDYTAPPQPSRSSSTSENNYQMIAANWLKNQIIDSNITDKVEIFSRYHQQSKQLDRWYIEPDGSLRPKRGDYSAELVGPPVSPSNALRDLQSISQLASQTGIYTNGSTGFHINISIPQTIDPLKLALFSGDTRALEVFGRLDSEHGKRYATSVLRSLKARTPGASPEPSASQQMQQYITNLNVVTKELMSNHFASISMGAGGRYISFRHAGGDYLQKLPELIQTIKGFVRAIIIASDPEAYKNEYINKLSKLIEKPSVGSNFDSTIQTLREHGLPEITLYMVPFNEQMSGNITLRQYHESLLSSEQLVRLLLSKLQIDSNDVIVSVDSTPDDRIKEQLIGPGGFRPNTGMRLQQTGNRYFYEVTIVPKNLKGAHDISNNRFIRDSTEAAAIRDNTKRVGIVRVGPDRYIPLTAQQVDSFVAAAARTPLAGPRGPLPENVRYTRSGITDGIRSLVRMR